MLGSACDCASECILNLLKAFYLGGGQCVIKGIAVLLLAVASGSRR